MVVAAPGPDGHVAAAAAAHTLRLVGAMSLARSVISW